MKFSKKDIFVFLIEMVVFCGLFWLIDSYVVHKSCKNTDNDIVYLSDDDDRPRTFEDYSEEERQVYSIVMDECVYDIKQKYDGEDFYIMTPCMYVAKDVVRVIFNSGTLSPEYTIHDVYEESKDRVIKVALEKGMITKKVKK